MRAEFVNQIWNRWACVLFSLSHTGDCCYGFKGKSAFLRISTSNPHFFKYQQRGNFHQGSFPPPQFGKRQPLAYAKKGKHTFCIRDFCNSFTLDILSPTLSTTQSQIRQRNTKEGICCPFLLVVEQSCDGTALMSS